MAALPDGIYFIRNVQSKTFLSFGAAMPCDNCVGATWTLENADRQLFTVRAVKPNNYVLTHIWSGKVVDLTGSNKADGTPIILYEKTGNPNQTFELASQGSTVFEIKSVVSGQAVDLDLGRADEDTKITNWYFDGGQHQLWQFIKATPAPTAQFPIDPASSDPAPAPSKPVDNY